MRSDLTELREAAHAADPQLPSAVDAALSEVVSTLAQAATAALLTAPSSSPANQSNHSATLWATRLPIPSLRHSRRSAGPALPLLTSTNRTVPSTANLALWAPTSAAQGLNLENLNGMLDTALLPALAGMLGTVADAGRTMGNTLRLVLDGPGPGDDEGAAGVAMHNWASAHLFRPEVQGDTSLDDQAWRGAVLVVLLMVLSPLVATGVDMLTTHYFRKQARRTPPLSLPPLPSLSRVSAFAASPPLSGDQT